MRSFTGGHNAENNNALEKEQLAILARRLAVEVDEFFTHQENLLQMAYQELSSRVEQLRNKVQYVSLMTPSTTGLRDSPTSNNPSYLLSQNALPPVCVPAPCGNGSGGLYSSGTPTTAVTGSGVEPAHTSGTPLRSSNPHNILLSGTGDSFRCSHTGNSAINSTYNPPQTTLDDQLLSTAHNNHMAVATNGTSTPLRMKANAAVADLSSPSMTSILDDRLGGDWGSLSITHRSQSHLQRQPVSVDTVSFSLMASPQATGKLSLDDLLSRFSGSGDHAPSINFDILYEQLTDGGKDDIANVSQDRREKEQSGTLCLGEESQQLAPAEDQGTRHVSVAPGSSRATGVSAEKDVIPIDMLCRLHDQYLTKSVKAIYKNGRPSATPIPGGKPDDPAELGVDTQSNCQILVEFKRKRVLQFDSHTYVAPGSYVMVGGDRGEDLGLVTYTCCEVKRKARDDADNEHPNLSSRKKNKNNGKGSSGKNKKGGEPITVASAVDSCGQRSEAESNSKRTTTSSVIGIGLTGSILPRTIGVGNGTVLRLATDADIKQLHGTQTELEFRAVDVCTQRVLDHALPMVIVDAEYQYDKKKLTFFFEAQQRMDFRDLVRDLYKTFRARIWMEFVDI